MAETTYTDEQRGVISYATSAKVSVSIGGVQLSDDVLGIDFTGSVSGTFDTETGIATVPIAAGSQQGQQNQILGRLSSGIGPFEAFIITDLVDQVTPAGGDALMGQRASDGALIQIDVGNLPTGGGGEVNLGANVGTGFGTFDAKVGVTLNMRSINPLGILQGALNAQSIDLDFDDTASGNIVGRVLPGSGKPSFLIPSETQGIVLGDDNGRDLANQYPDAPAQFSTDFTFNETTSGRRLIQINPSGTTVEMTLPDATTLTGQDGWLCDVRVASGAFASSVVVAVTGQMSVQNGYNSFDGEADEQFFGLNQATALNNVYSLYKRGGVYQWQAGFFRNAATDDQTFDGPLDIIAIGGTPVNLSNVHRGTMVELTNVGAMTLDVSGVTGPGQGIEIHKLLAGDVDVIVGAVGATTIPSGEARLLRVRTGNIKYIS